MHYLRWHARYIVHTADMRCTVENDRWFEVTQALFEERKVSQIEPILSRQGDHPVLRIRAQRTAYMLSQKTMSTKYNKVHT
jgi:hypothetical protein